ncbi:MAG: hypothetical protein ACSLE8_19485 [Rhodococcus sp. (in: high G+C Gram-positive bacteria)]
MSEPTSTTTLRRDNLRCSERWSRAADLRQDTEDGEPASPGRHRAAGSRAATDGHGR